MNAAVRRKFGKHIRSTRGNPIEKVVLSECALPSDRYSQWVKDPNMPELDWDFHVGQYADSDEE